jgi:hypothetical protein
MKCQSCGADNPGEAVFCKRCGAKLEAPPLLEGKEPALPEVAPPLDLEKKETRGVLATPWKELGREKKLAVIGINLCFIAIIGAVIYFATSGGGETGLKTAEVRISAFNHSDDTAYEYKVYLNGELVEHEDVFYNGFWGPITSEVDKLPREVTGTYELKVEITPVIYPIGAETKTLTKTWTITVGEGADIYVSNLAERNYYLGEVQIRVIEEYKE